MLLYLDQNYLSGIAKRKPAFRDLEPVLREAVSAGVVRVPESAVHRIESGARPDLGLLELLRELSGGLRLPDGGGPAERRCARALRALLERDYPDRTPLPSDHLDLPVETLAYGLLDADLGDGPGDDHLVRTIGAQHVLEGRVVKAAVAVLVDLRLPLTGRKLRYHRVALEPRLRHLLRRTLADEVVLHVDDEQGRSRRIERERLLGRRHRYSSSASSSMESTPPSAFDTGQPSLAAWACCWNSSWSIPGTLARERSRMCVIAKPSPTWSSWTVASVSTLSGSWPACPSPADSAIEKQPAWAAAISSSGFVPSPSSKRDWNE